MRLSYRRWSLAVRLAALVLLILPALALAHERRTIGDYEFVVGWVNEPAFVEDANQVDLRVTNVHTKEPVEGLEQTVKLDVSYGGRSKTFNLRPRFGQPGAYVADVLPTRTGDYVFHFTGTVNGMPLDARFDSADGRFNGVQPKTEIAFPEPPVATGQLQERVAGVSSEAEAAQASAQTALLVGGAGVVLGLLGLIVGGLAWASARRQTAVARSGVAEPERV